MVGFMRKHSGAVLGIMCLAGLFWLHFDDYGTHWAFVDGYPTYLIDEHGLFPDGTNASPLDLAMFQSGKDKAVLLFNTIIILIILLAFILAGIYDLYHYQKARSLYRQNDRLKGERWRFHHP